MPSPHVPLQNDFENGRCPNMAIAVYRSMTHLTMDCFQSEDDCLQFFSEFQINYFRRRIAHYENIQENDTINIFDNIALLFTDRYITRDISILKYF